MNGVPRIVWTIGLVFLVAALSKFLDIGGSVFELGETWGDLVDAGLAAVAAFVINAASPWIKQYGVGSGTGE